MTTIRNLDDHLVPSGFWYVLPGQIILDLFKSKYKSSELDDISPTLTSFSLLKFIMLYFVEIRSPLSSNSIFLSSN